MPTNDGFDPDHPLPSFLSGHADEHDEQEQWSTSEQEQWGTSEYEQYEQWSTSDFEQFQLPRTSPLLKAGIVAMVVMAGGIAIALSLGNPAKLFADATASLLDNSAVRAAEQSTSAILSAADAQTSAPTAPIARAAPARDQIAAVAELANQAQTETAELPPGTLLRQFQAWAARQDAQAQEAQIQQARAADTETQPPAQPTQAYAAQIEDDSPAPEQTAHKHRKLRSVQNARTEIRHVQRPRARVQQNAPGQAQPLQDARAQEQPGQTAQSPSFLQSIGLQQHQ